MFWKKRRTLQKASYLLINLAFADLLLGVCHIILLVTQIQPNLFNSELNERIFSFQNSHFLATIQIIFVCSSVFSLAVISLERVYAVVWPLHHRTVSSRVYFSSIGFIWAAGIGAGMLYILSVVEVISREYAYMPTNGTILSSLCVVCASYMIIRKRVRRTPLIFDNQRRRNMERHIKLSNTLFIMISLSLICWLPATVTYTFPKWCQKCISSILILVTIVLYMANSIVNPVVYCYRMPIFKDELKRCFEKCKFNSPRHPRNDGIGQPEYFDTRL